MRRLDFIDYPSPNFGDRRLPVDMIVIHYTEMTDTAKTLAHLSNPDAEVSSHYLIDYDGTIYRLVDEEKRAWHAGVSRWQGVADVNSRSIGIEIMNDGKKPYTPAQMNALAALCHDIKSRHVIKPENIVGHSDVAPVRKIDPGPHFDWAWLARQGIENVHAKKLSTRFGMAARHARRKAERAANKALRLIGRKP